MPTRTLRAITNLVLAAQKADKVDEHGNWEFGLDWVGGPVGSATNWDIYGYGRDVHSRRLLAVIQIRQFTRRKRNYFPQILKSYFLLGRNEDDTVFAHPVEARVVHSAITRKKDVVRCVQNWIFGADYQRVLRQGDLALVPMPNLTRLIEEEGMEENRIILQAEDGSLGHQLTAEKIVRNGNLYAFNAELVHLPGTHPKVIHKGWAKVIIGKRANFHDFAAPTID